ncbi:Csa1 family protein [Carnobacterium gallinarum]
MYEYQKRPLMEYFSSRESSVNILNSAKNRTENGDLVSKGMVLKYYPTEKKAYGKYFERLYLKEAKVGEGDEVKETFIMFDGEKYHVKENAELTEEIKNFKFMIEEFDFTKDYTKNFKIEKSGYNFEVPSYSLTYKLPQIDREIEAYIKTKGLPQYGEESFLEFNKDGEGYSGGKVNLVIQQQPNISIYELINTSVSETGGNDYRALFLGEETENEQETSDLQ